MTRHFEARGEPGVGICGAKRPDGPWRLRHDPLTYDVDSVDCEECKALMVERALEQLPPGFSWGPQVTQEDWNAIAKDWREAVGKPLEALLAKAIRR